MIIWLQNVFGVIKVIKSLPKPFLRTYYEVFFITQKFFWKSSKTVFRHIYFIDPKSQWDEFLLSEKFFHKKVWVLKDILSKVRRPFKAPISLRNLVRILTQNIRTQNTCYWISLCISSYYHSLQGWFCTYLMIKFIPQILRIVYNSQYWQYVCLFDANVLFFGYVQMFESNSYTFSTHTIGI